ncbi:phage minor capsid protein [Glutamicibacter sp. NPDC087344]|uniref:phage minor capsid protein n=1 Tax=Glutamicibacter sp. NPDC087344 TaxID=3363994 RepID=UPI00380A6CE6
MRPNEARDLAERIRDIYVGAESLILQRLARAVANTGDAPDWLTTRLMEQRNLLRQLDKILADLDRQVPGAVEQVIGLAYNRGVAFAVHDAEKAGIETDLFGRVANTGAEAVIARAATEPLGAMRLNVRRWALDVFNRVTQQAAAVTISGVVTRREASARLLQKLAGQGVKGFTDRSGRQWEMASYAEMATRTATSQALREGHGDRLLHYGVDTVIVSDSPEECKLCRPFEGKVLSLTGNTTGRLKDGKTVVASLREANGKGLFHPGCTHSYSVYLPGITRGPGRVTANPEGDRLRQTQRAYERRVRELKREKILMQDLDPAAAKQAGVKLRAKQDEFAAWREANDRKNLSYRTNLKAR